MSDLLAGLNREQLAAVTHGDGPLMIIAGAGTGKTSVITKRIAWLIEQDKAKPEEILALTFTDKAAGEMEERVDQLLPIGYVDLWISTFHAFCERVLRANALEIGLPNEFKLIDEIEAYLLVRKNLDRFDLNYYRPRGNPTKFIQALLSHFSRAKDELISPDRYVAYADELKVDDAMEKTRVAEVANAFHVYQQILLENNCLDFADLITYTIELFKTRPNILKRYAEQFKYLLVDEFQDTNSAQYELIKLLASAKRNITVVGDDDQSIYRFRGASLSNIEHFRQDFGEARRVVLNKNYRSVKEVLESAYQLIQFNNPHRLEVQEALDKKLQSQTTEGGSVEHLHCATGEDESQELVKKIIDLKASEHAAWNDFCLLVRANDHAEPFIAAFERLGIPYRFLALSGLYTKGIILDALAYLRVVDFPHESPSLYRILSHERLGLNAADLAELGLYAKRKGRSLIEALKAESLISNLTASGRTRIRELLDLLTRLRDEARRQRVSEFFLTLMSDSGLLADVRLLSDGEQKEAFELLQQFYERLKKFESSNDDKTLHHFVAEFEHEREAGEAGSLKADAEAGPEVVNIMTVHASKGLEFPYVFIANLVEQRFPSTSRSEAIPLPDALLEQLPQADHHLEEERRLFYVALTRAKKRVYLLSAENYGGSRARKVSRFVKELGFDQVALPSTTERAVIGNQTERRVATTAPKYAVPNKMSFTQLATFSTCPLQYKFAHILRVPIFGRHTFSFGQTMHKTLEKFLKLILEKESSPQASLFPSPIEAPKVLPPLSELMRLYEESWIDDWYPNQDTKVEYAKKGKESLQILHSQLQTQLPKILYLEKAFTLKIGSVTVKGRIDRIDELDDGVEIIDYKTGSPKDKLTWEDKRQLVLYQLAAQSCFTPPLQVNGLTYHYLEDNSRLTFQATPKDLERLQAEILETVSLMSQSDFSATPGWYCRYCDYKDICEFAQR
jgi:DNA helicase-2/ATP-dependent DNA helicase PcrA